MVDPIPDLAGVRGFRFTGADQLFKVPPKITSVWLSGIGGGGAAITRQFGEWWPRGLANVPLVVEPSDHIRVRVGGRPEIVGRDDDGVVDFEWKLSTTGGWNGGGNGGGTWGGDPIGNPGEIHACGGGGATTFHLIPAGANPVSTLGDLVAVMPGAPGTLRGFLGALGLVYTTDGTPLDILRLYDKGPDYLYAAASAFSFAGDPPPAAETAEYLGALPDIADMPLPESTPPTPTWITLDDPVDVTGGTGATFTTGQDVSLGNPGESFKGGAGRRFAGAAATPGGGGGYGGGASGSRLTVDGADTLTISGDPRDLTFDLAMGARHGGFLLPIDRPDDWDSRPPIDPDGVILTTTLDDVEAPLLYLPVAGSSEDPFGVYDFTDADIKGDNPDTMRGHGSARIQWARDPKRARWRVGHVGWGRNNGW